MKKKLILPLLLVLSCTLFSGYIYTRNPINNKTKVLKENASPSSQITSIKEPTLFYKDTFINNKPVLQISYRLSYR